MVIRGQFVAIRVLKKILTLIPVIIVLLSVISLQPDLKSGCGEYQDFQSASPCLSALQMLIFVAVGLQIRPNRQFVSFFF